ncbi:response regulator [Marinobacterium arenosum]|uniref:response regulator n=1 Tax=Marinobacterium arenosum TaxID=2862496 RepID=UPI001C9475E7|nr:response regulator [Marinobacterium arenosum]MBY4676072.1 response regulator [Marinobacterium arenosum]
MAERKKFSILLVTAKRQDFETLGNLVKRHFSNFFWAKSEQAALDTIRKQQIDVLLLALDTVQESEVYYLHLIRADRNIENMIGHTMVLCNKEEVQQAFHICHKEIFDDYFIARPLYDPYHLLLRLRAIRRQRTDNRQPMQAPGSPEELCDYLDNVLLSSKQLDNLNERSLEKLYQAVSHSMERLKDHLLQHEHLMPSADPGVVSQAIDQFAHNDLLPPVKAQGEDNRREAKAILQHLVQATEQKLATVNNGAGRRTKVTSRELINQLCEENNLSPSDARSLLGDLLKSSKKGQATLDQISSDNLDQISSDNLDQISSDNLEPQHGILIIEDEQEHLSTINEILARAGFVTYPAISGTDALNKIDDWLPSIAMVDLTLPDMSALHVLSRIKNNPKLKNTKIIVMAKPKHREQIQEAIKVGVNEVMLKPVDKELLLYKVNYNLNQPASAMAD